MRRIPVYELIDQRSVVDDVEGPAPRSVFRPLTGDECTIALSCVQISLAQESEEPVQKAAAEDGYGDYTCSAWFGEAAPEDGTVRLRMGEADCTTDRGLEAVLRGMTPGESREFCLGDGRGARVSGRVHLTAVRPTARRTDDRLKLVEAAAHKDAGNRLYGLGRYADAFHRFSRAARALLMVRNQDGARAAGLDALYAAVCNNMAACQLRAGNLEHAHKLADKALSADPDNVKALVRRCRAAAGLRMWDAALEDAKRALARDPSNAVARQYADAAVRGVHDQQVVYETMVKKMFAA